MSDVILAAQLGDWGSVAQAVVGGIGLGGVVVTLFRQGSAERALAYQAISDQTITIDQIFIEHPEMRPYFYDKVTPAPGTDTYMRALALAEAVVDMLDNIVQQSRRLEKKHRDPFEDYFRDVYHSSPVIQEFWTEHKHWYCSELRDVLDRL